MDAPPSELAVGASSVLAALLLGSWLALRLRAREHARLAPVPRAPGTAG